MSKNLTNKFIKFELVSPQESFVEQKSYLVNLPAKEGQMGAMYGHVAMLVELSAGVVIIFDGLMKIIHKLYISGGYSEITEQKVTVICNEFAPLDSFNIVDLQRKLSQLEQLILLEADQLKKTELEQDLAKVINLQSIISSAK